MMTKEQERKALEQLKKLIATLDEDGYVATALRGVVSDAEQNIDNDWALSRYDAWQDAEYRADKNEAMLVETADKLAEAQRALEAEIARRESAEAMLLSTRENAAVQRILIEYRNDQAARDAEYRDIIVANCETPDCDAYKQAVYQHKLATREVTMTEKLVEALDKQIRPTAR